MRLAWGKRFMFIYIRISGYNGVASHTSRRKTMSSKDSVIVRILDLPGAGGGCACSDPTLSPEYTIMLKQKVSELKASLDESYPGKTVVEYVDLRQDEKEKETELGQLLATKKYPPPLVVINAVPKFAGSIQVKKIVKEVGTILS
jgi:disulfide oxidoreductase YuzD